MKTQITPPISKAILQLAVDIISLRDNTLNDKVTVERLQKAMPHILRLRTEVVYFEYKVRAYEDMINAAFQHTKLKHKAAITQDVERCFMSYVAQRTSEINLCANDAISGK